MIKKQHLIIGQIATFIIFIVFTAIVFAVNSMKTNTNLAIDKYYIETQEITTEEIFVPQNGSSSSVYFNRFDTQGGTRVLRGVEFFVQNNKRLFHGIEVLDNYPFYWNCIGLELDYTCDCENPIACNNSPDGPWIKSKFTITIGETELTQNACSENFGISVVGAPGPFDGVLDFGGDSGNYRNRYRYCAFSVPRNADADVLAEFTGNGVESTHMRYVYGGVNRLNCPHAIEHVNVDSEYGSYVSSTVTCIYYWTYTK